MGATRHARARERKPRILREAAPSSAPAAAAWSRGKRGRGRGIGPASRRAGPLSPMITRSTTGNRGPIINCYRLPQLESGGPRGSPAVSTGPPHCRCLDRAAVLPLSQQGRLAAAVSTGPPYCRCLNTALVPLSQQHRLAAAGCAEPCARAWASMRWRAAPIGSSAAGVRYCTAAGACAPPSPRQHPKDGCSVPPPPSQRRIPPSPQRSWRAGLAEAHRRAKLRRTAHPRP